MTRYQSAVSQAKISQELKQSLLGVTQKLKAGFSSSSTHERIIWETSISVIGPAFFFFTRWVLDHAAKIDLKKLYFLSRDGEIFLKIVQVIKRQADFNIECRYLYGSRHLWLLASLEDFGDKELKWIFSDWWYPITVRSVCKRLGMDPEGVKDSLLSAGFPPKTWDQILSFGAKQRLKRTLKEPKFKSIIVDHLQATYANTLGYLVQEGLADGKASGVVDIGWRGKPQLSLRRILNRGGIVPGQGLKGFYFGLTEGKEVYPGDQLFSFLFDLSRSLQRFQLRNNHLYEAFAASQEGRLLNFCREDEKFYPVLDPCSARSLIQWGLPLQQKGILAFSEEFSRVYSLESLNWDEACKILETTLGMFISAPSMDEASVYGSFPLDGELTQSKTSEIAPIVSRRQFWSLCFNLKNFNLFWVQGSLQRSKLFFEERIWNSVLFVLQVCFYGLVVANYKLRFSCSEKNRHFKTV